MPTMTKGKAELELVVLSKEAERLDESEIFVLLDKAGLPLEFNTRLMDLWKVTKSIAGQVIHLGKIIVMKIIQFVKANPNTALGMLIGAAIGALTNLIPFIGPMLAPLMTVIGATLGGISGAGLDHPEANSTFQGLIVLAKEFFKTVAEIFNMLKDLLFGKELAYV